MIEELKQLLDNQKTRMDWDTYFSSLALLISSRSPCHRLHVGCVIVGEKRVLATGYNGFLPNAEHISVVRNNHEQATVHAEQNAISQAAKTGVCIKGATAYVTHYPCINCCKIMIASGISKIKYMMDYKNDPLVRQFCSQVGVTCERFSKISSKTIPIDCNTKRVTKKRKQM